MKNKKIFFGIDPGKSGCITIFNGSSFKFINMPTHKVDTGKKSKTGKPVMKTVFNEKGFKNIIKKLYHEYNNCELLFAIEEVHGRGGWSATNNYNFGYVAGLQRMIPIMLGAKYIMVRPQKWQSVMYSGYDKIMVPSSTGKTMVPDAKATSKMVAEDLYPNIDFRKTERSKNTDDNKIDSFLICLYNIKLNNK